MLRLCHLVGVFFLFFFHQHGTKICLHFIFSCILLHRCHSIGSILFEKKRKRKQKHRLSMAQKKTTRYTQWVPYRRFYTIWFVKKSLTTSKHIIVAYTSPFMMYHHYFRSTAPARPQKRFWYSVAFIRFARLWVSLYENLCRLFFIIFFYRNSLHYSVRCYPFLV